MRQEIVIIFQLLLLLLNVTTVTTKHAWKFHWTTITTNYHPFSMQCSMHLQFKRTPRFLFALPPTQQPESLSNYIYPEWIAIHCDSHTCCTWNTFKSSHMQTNSVIIILTCCLLIFWILGSSISRRALSLIHVSQRSFKGLFRSESVDQSIN